MGLIDLQTDLKSIKFGTPPATDVQGGGNSAQPYLKTPIPDTLSPTTGNNLASNDFVLRGGINSARDTARDVVRLTKYFTDFKSVSGALFTAKQNVLSQISVKTQSSTVPNGGVYTPLSTLAQAGINFIGGHVNKQGLLPFKDDPTYSSSNSFIIGDENGKGNRLAFLYNTKISPQDQVSLGSDNPNVYSYSGGPNSNVGVGKTNIKFATDNQGGVLRTGFNNSKLIDTRFPETQGQKGSTLTFLGNSSGYLPSETHWDPTTIPFQYYNPIEYGSTAFGFNPSNRGVSFKYNEIYPNTKLNEGLTLNNSTDGLFARTFEIGVYNPGTLTPREDLNTYQIGLNYTRVNMNMFKSPTGVSDKYNGVLTNNFTSDGGITWDPNFNTSVYSDGLNLTPREDLNTYQIGLKTNPENLFIDPINASTKYKSLSGKGGQGNWSTDIAKNWLTWEQNFITSVYKDGTLEPSDIIKNPSSINQNFKTLDQAQLNQQISYRQTGEVQDFRVPFEVIGKKSSTIMSIAPSYQGQGVIDNNSGNNLNSYTSPGQKNKNLISYTRGSGIGPIDKVNAQPLYLSQDAEKGVGKDDLIPFRIGAISTKMGPSGGDFDKEFIHFRAYIDSFSDGYSAQWEGQKYMGRGESLYKYGGFDRKINLSFTVAAQSKEELLAQYKKLNFLVSNLAPEYTNAGYMSGPLVTLTMGGWCHELAGFIEGMTLEVPEDSPWEIGIKDNGEKDGDISQLPHIIRVTGFTFTPIHNFRPEKQQNEYTTAGELSYLGGQHYIQMWNATDTNELITIQDGPERFTAEEKEQQQEQLDAALSIGRDLGGFIPGTPADYGF